MKIKVNRLLVKQIKEARIKREITQQEFADFFNISRTKYNRFENGSLKTFEKELLEKITNYLEINSNLASNIQSNIVKTSIRIPQDIYTNLKFYQQEKDLDSISETIVYCLNEFFINSTLTKSKYEIKDFIEEMILITFAKEMKNMNKDVSKYKHLIEFLEEKYEFDEDIEQHILNEIDSKNLNAKV